MQKKLFVGGLPYSTQQEEVEQLFSQCGQVVSATIVRDKFTNQSRGFGFVEMETEEQAADAISKLNGTQIGGRTIVVNESRPKEMRAPGGERGGDRGNRPRFNNQRRNNFRN
jgi:RNA recognition motif-containing protein